MSEAVMTVSTVEHAGGFPYLISDKPTPPPGLLGPKSGSTCRNPKMVRAYELHAGANFLWPTRQLAAPEFAIAS